MLMWRHVTCHWKQIRIWARLLLYSIHDEVNRALEVLKYHNFSSETISEQQRFESMLCEQHGCTANPVPFYQHDKAQNIKITYHCFWLIAVRVHTSVQWGIYVALIVQIPHVFELAQDDEHASRLWIKRWLKSCKLAVDFCKESWFFAQIRRFIWATMISREPKKTELWQINCSSSWKRSF